MTPPGPALRYTTAVSLILAGAAVLFLPRFQATWVTALYSLALALLVLMQANSAPQTNWVGLGIALLGSWSPPILTRLLAPILPPTNVIPASIAWGLFVIGNVLIGLSVNNAGAFRKHSGSLLAVGAVLTPLLGSFVYAIALGWIGLQLFRGDAPILGSGAAGPEGRAGRER